MHVEHCMPSLETTSSSLQRDATPSRHVPTASAANPARSHPGPGTSVRGRIDLTQGSIPRSLLIFALPTLISNVLQSLNTSVNAMWIGRLLGEHALTASANANGLLFLLIGGVFGLSMAAMLLVGQSFGAGNLVQAKRTVGTSVTFFGLIAAFLCLLGVLFTPRILAAMHTPHDALPLATAYLRPLFIAVPGMYLYVLIIMALCGAGDAKTPLCFLSLSTLVDITLNPCLILGLGPLPAFGIAGAAYATVLAQWLSLFALLVYLYKCQHALRLTASELHFLKPDLPILRALLTKGIPMGLEVIVVSSSMFALLRLVNGCGSRTTAAYGACIQLWSYIQLPALAVGSAVSAMVAQNVGARLWPRVATIAQVGVVFNVVLTGVLVLLVTVAGDRAFGLFLGENLEAIRVAEHIHAITAWAFVLFGVSFVLASVMRATGAVIAPLLIMVVSLWLVRVSFAAVFRSTLQADAIWWSFPLGSTTAVILSALYYRSGRWRRGQWI